jgi:hypothetical protein
MTLGDDLVARLERAVARYGAGTPTPAHEVEARLAPLGVVVPDDLVELVGRWGGCYVGVSVHAWDNASILGRETCVDLTLAARAQLGDVVTGLVFADDGAGNPIWVADDGRVLRTDADSGESEELAPSFRAFLVDNVHD